MKAKLKKKKGTTFRITFLQSLNKIFTEIGKLTFNMLIMFYLFINTSVIAIYHEIKMNYLHSFVGLHVLNLARALYLTAHLNLDLAALQGLSSLASLRLQILKGASLINND